MAQVVHWLKKELSSYGKKLPNGKLSIIGADRMKVMAGDCNGAKLSLKELPKNLL